MYHYSEMLNYYSFHVVNVLKSLSIGIMAFTAIIMIGSVSIQNQVFAPRQCAGCIAKFQILTRSFGADAGKIILSEHSFPITQFIQLNLQFDKSIIKAVYDGHAIQGDPVIRDLVNQYGEDLLNLHPPESVKPLLLAYQQGVLKIFFPDP